MPPCAPGMPLTLFSSMSAEQGPDRRPPMASGNARLRTIKTTPPCGRSPTSPYSGALKNGVTILKTPAGSEQHRLLPYSPTFAAEPHTDKLLSFLPIPYQSRNALLANDRLAPEAVVRALAKVYRRGRGVIAKIRADHLALARNSISPSKSILREEGASLAYHNSNSDGLR